MAFVVGLIQPINTLPETYSSHLKIGQARPQKETFVFQSPIFRCENVSFREGNL